MKCEIVQDLLPLYCDHLCSTETCQAVEEHLAGCSSCQDCWKRMVEQVEPVPLCPEEGAGARVLRGFKKRYSRQRRRSVLVTAAVMLVFALTLLGAADIECPIAYTDGMMTAKLAEDGVIDLYYHGGHYASFHGFSQEVGGRNIVFLCLNRSLRSDVIPLSGEGHFSIGNAWLTDYATNWYKVSRDVDAVYYLVGDYIQLPQLGQTELEKAAEDAVLLWER